MKEKGREEKTAVEGKGEEGRGNHLLLVNSKENKMLMLCNTMWARQKGLETLTAALKKKIHFKKNKWKKAFGETQTLRSGCSKAEPNIFAPTQTPFPGAQDCQNLICWRWLLPSPTDPVWRRSMHAISSYRGNRYLPPATNKHTHPQTGPITIHCAAASLARSVIIVVHNLTLSYLAT